MTIYPIIGFDEFEKVYQDMVLPEYHENLDVILDEMYLIIQSENMPGMEFNVREEQTKPEYKNLVFSFDAAREERKNMVLRYTGFRNE